MQHWPLILNDLVLGRMHTPFEWGRNDCCLFAADVVKALIGIDPAEKFRGRYTDALGAKRLLTRRRLLITDLPKYVGFVEINPATAQRGDMVCTLTPDHGPSLGICVGATGAFTGHSGLLFVPISNCSRAWRV